MLGSSCVYSASALIAVFESWKLGVKGKDNGVLVIVVPNYHRMRIEAGYGLEGILSNYCHPFHPLWISSLYWWQSDIRERSPVAAWEYRCTAAFQQGDCREIFL